MSKVVLKVENVSKQYRLGQLGTGTMSHDINRWWHKVRGKEDPYLKIGDSNDRSVAGGSEYVWSLKDINFEVEQGEVLGIIGKNGAGKSTLLKILSQVTTPTTGEFKAKGRIASLLEVGTGFHPDLSGRENVFLNGAILGMSKVEIKSKLDEIVDFSGVAKYLDTPVKRYSSGMMVRLGFAVAAHLEPEILIVDEVLAVGDAEFQKKCLGKMKDVAGQGRTVLFVSHNMASIKALCTSGIILKNGHLSYEGAIEGAVDFYMKGDSNNIAIPLADRTDRKGNGKIRVKRICFQNTRNEEVVELVSGDYYKILFYFEVYELVDESQFTFVLQFKNENEELYTTIATDEQGVKFNSLPKQGVLEVELTRLSFREGCYSFGYMMSETPSFNSEHRIMDYISEVTKVNVIRGDYWKTGILNRPKGFIQESNIKILNI